MAGNEVRIRAWVKDEVTGTLGKIHDKFESVGKSSGFKSLVQGVGMGAGISAYNLLGDAVSATTDFIGDSINASRDLSETLSKSKVIFGDSAKGIEAWGNTAATSMGLSKQAAIEAAATFGNFFVGLGETEQAAASMSKKVVGLAGDLASFNNMNPEEVLDKLRAGLAGEAEPLRRMGVFLTEAKVKAKAMEMGLTDAHGELSEGSKVLARYQIILDETATAQGDFARTSEGLANKQRSATAMLEDAQARLGKSFEPIALQTTEWQIDFIQGLGVAGNAVGELGGGIDDFVDTLTFWDGAMKNSEETAIRMAEHSAGAVEDMRGRVDWAAGEAEGAVRGFSSETKTMAKTTDKSTGKVVTYFERMLEGIEDTVDELQANAFDPIEERLDKQATHWRIVEGIKARESAKGKDAIVDANQEIVETLDDQVDHLQALGKRHKLTSKDIDQYESDVEASYKAMGKKVPKEIRKVISELRTLASFNGKAITYTVNIATHTGGKGAHKGKALGGPVVGGTTYLVGEKGPELFTAPSSGTIVPNDKLKHGGGMALGAQVNVNFYSSFPITPAQGQSVAREVGPYIRDYLARR